MASQRDNYFNIDDILATQERLQCAVELPCPRLGYLDPSGEGPDLQAGVKLEMPHWMAGSLCGRRRHIVAVETPKQYREGYREILAADPNVVDLYKLGPYYYRFGSHILSFELPESSDLAKCLLQTYQLRLRRIMDSSQNCLHEDTSKLTEKLDQSEQALFRAGQQGLNDFFRWETRQTEKLGTSEMVRQHRKRKRVVLENS